MSTPRTRILVAYSLALALAGCSFLQPQPDLSRFFVLTPMAATAGEAPRPLRLGLGPVELPAYLQRAQMVTRIGPNEITFSETYRWGESLQTNFTRVLTQNLSELVRTDQIVSYPWYGNEKLDYVIRVDVVQFEVDTEGEARLLARWKIVDPASDKVLRSAESDWQEPAADRSPDAAVAALSSLLEKLSREIAGGLEALRH